MDRTPEPDRQHEVFHPEALAWLVGHLDADERREFAEELKPYVAEIQEFVEHADAADAVRVSAVFGEFAAILRAWQVSVQLDRDPEWVAQVEEAEARWDGGGSQAFTTVKEMRDALAS